MGIAILAVTIFVLGAKLAVIAGGAMAASAVDIAFISIEQAIAAAFFILRYAAVAIPLITIARGAIIGAVAALGIGTREAIHPPTIDIAFVTTFLAILAMGGLCDLAKGSAVRGVFNADLARVITGVEGDPLQALICDFGAIGKGFTVTAALADPIAGRLAETFFMIHGRFTGQ